MMKMLLINVCGTEGVVAVAEETGVLGEEKVDGRSSSESLLGAIRRLLSARLWEVRELTVVGVVVGPGSFTGVRVGLSIAKGICEAAGCRMVALSRLALVGNTAMLDAGRGEYFLGDAEGERIIQHAAHTHPHAEAVTCERRVSEALGISLVHEPDGSRMLDAVLARLHSGTWSDVGKTDANYLRRTDAEILVHGA